MAAQSFLLLVGDDGALLFRPPSRGAVQPPLFARTSDEAATEGLLKTLEAAPHAPVLLLVDTLAQEYRRESLPPLSFFDRSRLIKRRLTQAFPKTEWRGSLSSKGEALFVALDEASAAGSWLRRLSALRNPMEGVCLLPLEATSLFARLAPGGGWRLLLAAHATGGFRQIVMRDNQLVFTRLTPPLPPVASPDYIAETLAQDVRSTRAYLARSGLAEETPLPLTALLPAFLHDALKNQKIAASPLELFTPLQAAEALGLRWPGGFDPSAADVLAGLWLQKTKRPLSLLRREADRTKRATAFIQKGGLVLACIALFLAFAHASGLVHDLMAQARDNAKTAETIAVLQNQIEASREALRKEAEPLEALRKAVQRRRLYAARQDGPAPLWPLIDAALGAQARVVAVEAKDSSLSLEIELRDDGLSGDPATLSRADLLHRFEELAETMRQSLDGYNVALTRLPFPALPQETLTNKGRPQSEPPPIATLTLEKERTP